MNFTYDIRTRSIFNDKDWEFILSKKDYPQLINRIKNEMDSELPIYLSSREIDNLSKLCEGTALFDKCKQMHESIQQELKRIVLGGCDYNMPNGLDMDKLKLLQKSNALVGSLSELNNHLLMGKADYINALKLVKDNIQHFLKLVK